MWRSIIGAILDVEREGVDDGRPLGVGVAAESSQLGKRIEILLPADGFLHPDDVIERRGRNQPTAGDLDDQCSRFDIGIDEQRLVGARRRHEYINVSSVGLPLRVANEVIRVDRMLRHRTEIGQRLGKAAPILTVGANEHVDVARDVVDGAMKQSRGAADDDIPDVMRSEGIDDAIEIEWCGLWRRHAAELRRNVR